MSWALGCKDLITGELGVGMALKQNTCTKSGYCILYIFTETSHGIP